MLKPASSKTGPWLTKARARLFTQVSFFLLFLLAPALDIFRLDLTQGHFILFGHPLSLGLHDIQQGNGSAWDAASSILLRAFLPGLVIVATGLLIFWRYGRLYCGWLCPHFSIVETINRSMEKNIGKPTIWERNRSKASSLVGKLRVFALAGSFAFLWALALLSYLIPPFPLYHDLFTGNLTGWPSIFLPVATLAFLTDFLFARHLFCRYGCAVGFFQSLFWMANPKAMVVGFDKSRAAACQSCNSKCDAKCPMRLPPRTIKRMKLSCTQCGQCISACEQQMQDVAEANGVDGNSENVQPTVIKWVQGDDAKIVDRSPTRR